MTKEEEEKQTERRRRRKMGFVIKNKNDSYVKNQKKVSLNWNQKILQSAHYWRFYKNGRDNDIWQKKKKKNRPRETKKKKNVICH